MAINFKSRNPIILQFPRFTGGKFISNCLSLSKHAVPQDLNSAIYLLNHPNDYDFRLNSVLSTLPVKNQMVNWISKYEFGDRQLYGKAFESWSLGEIGDINAITEKLTNSSLKFFIVCHSGPDSVSNIIKVWPNSSILILKNYEKFFNISAKKKSINNEALENYAGNYCKERYNLIAGTDWPSWEDFQNMNYNTDNKEIQKFYQWYLIKNKKIFFDIDSNIFNKNLFLTGIRQLYDFFEFDDFNHQLIGHFWQRYIELHIDESDKILYNKQV